MENSLLQNRSFLDGRTRRTENLEDVSVIQEILQSLNQHIFRGAGECKVIPVTNGANTRELFCAILASGGHFTLQTFGADGAFYADVYSEQSYCESYVGQLLDHAFRPSHMDMHTGYHSDYFGAGKHEVVRLPRVTMQNHALLTKVIIKKMQTITLCGPLVCTQKRGDSLQPLAGAHVAIHNCAGEGTVLDAFSRGSFDLSSALQDFGITPLESASISRGIDC